MSLSKRKCWHFNNCLHFLKHAVPFGRCRAHRKNENSKSIVQPDLSFANIIFLAGFAGRGFLIRILWFGFKKLSNYEFGKVSSYVQFMLCCQRWPRQVQPHPVETLIKVHLHGRFLSAFN